MADAPTPEPPIDPDATEAFEPGLDQDAVPAPAGGDVPPDNGGPPDDGPPDDGGRNVWWIVFAVVVILLLVAILLVLLLRDGSGDSGPTTTTTEETTTTSSTTTTSTSTSTSTTTSTSSTTTTPTPSPACSSEALLAATGGSIDGHPIEVVDFACATSDDPAGTYAWALVEATDVVLDPLNVFFEADGADWRTLDYGTGIVCDDVIPSSACDSMPGAPR